jgi:hypothetical protein
MRLLEVKEGSKTKELFQIMDNIYAENLKPEQAVVKYNLSRKDVEQMMRQLKQLQAMENLKNIINKDEGMDAGTGKQIKIFTPAEETPRYTEELYQLRKEFENRVNSAYTVIEGCLHIGIYKGHIDFIGHTILDQIGKELGRNYFIVDMRSIVQSLNKPIFTLPFEKQFIFDILFGRVSLLFMVDIDAYIKLAAEMGFVLEWASARETIGVKTANKNAEIFVFNNKGISVRRADQPAEQKTWLSYGVFLKMMFEQIYPSYTIYGFNYLLEVLQTKA